MKGRSRPQQSFFSTPYYRQEEPQTRYRPVQASTFPCGFWGSRGAEIVKSIHEQQEARHTVVSMKSRRMYLAVQKQLDRDTRKRHLCGYLNLEYLCRGVFYLFLFFVRVHNNLWQDRFRLIYRGASIPASLFREALQTIQLNRHILRK
jgi:hypothetical protein